MTSRWCACGRATVAILLSHQQSRGIKSRRIKPAGVHSPEQPDGCASGLAPCPPPSARDDAKGFVTRLVDTLRYKLEQEGWLAPDIWRDKTSDEGEEFDPRIVAALHSADIFLVVLSRVWIQRPYCRREAEHFLRRFRDEADGGHGSVVVVHKNRVSPA